LFIPQVQCSSPLSTKYSAFKEFKASGIIFYNELNLFNVLFETFAVRFDPCNTGISEKKRGDDFYGVFEGLMEVLAKDGSQRFAAMITNASKVIIRNITGSIAVENSGMTSTPNMRIVCVPGSYGM